MTRVLVAGDEPPAPSLDALAATRARSSAGRVSASMRFPPARRYTMRSGG